MAEAVHIFRENTCASDTESTDKSEPLKIKERRIFLSCAASFLHVSQVYAHGKSSLKDPVIFIGGQPAVDLRMLLCPEKGSVLAHQAYEEAALRKLVPDPLKKP